MQRPSTRLRVLAARCHHCLAPVKLANVEPGGSGAAWLHVVDGSPVNFYPSRRRSAYIERLIDAGRLTPLCRSCGIRLAAEARRGS